MRPYFERDGIALYLGDARDVLPSVPDVDLLLTDPPYGVEYRSNFRAIPFASIANDGADRSAVLAALAEAVARVSRNRHVYVFGGLSDDDAERLKLASLAELVWDKGVIGMGDLSLPWGPAHERITFGIHQPSVANRRRVAGALAARMRKGSVLRDLRPHGAAVTLHPTEKPVGILRQMIESSTVLGETVLDPFAGSGSTLVAAALEGRRAIGIEIEERYCEVAAKRLAQGALALGSVA